jgi:L-malate glycosyltransferase
MNILIITHTYPERNNSWRGSFVKEQVKSLCTVHNVTVVYFKNEKETEGAGKGYSVSKSIAGNLTEYTLTINKSFPVVNQFIFLLRTYQFINDEVLPGFRPDLIHSHLLFPGGFIATLLQQRKNIPNIITEHSRISTYFRSWVHKILVSYTLRKANTIVAVSNSLKAQINSYFPRPIRVIYNIVDVSKFKLNDKEDNGILNIGFLGGLGNNNKGLDILLKSVSLPGTKSFFLHIGGSGLLKNDYIKMAQELGIESKCKFYGEIPHNEIPEFYSALDLFILPSRYETFGIVLIEAMACGIPVIATRCGGPEEIVSDESGILIPGENAEELSNAIGKISENLRSYKKNIIRNYAEENFGRKVFLKRINKLYNETINSSTHE